MNSLTRFNRIRIISLISPMAKSDLKLKAKEMRLAGESIKKIAEILDVSSSSVSLWCRDIKLNSEQIAELERRNNDPHYGRRGIYLERLKKVTDDRKLRLKEEGIGLVGRLSRRERFLAGVALYWAEGFKKDKMVGLANTDPEMIKFIIRWFIECLGVEKNSFRLRVVINESHKGRADEIRDYWSRMTGLSTSQFYEPTFQKVKWSKVYDRPEEYFGVLRIRVLRSTDLLRRILGMIEGLGKS